MTMSTAELEILHTYLHQSKHYLEFGSGDSTFYAAKTMSIETIDSVESSASYVDEYLRPKHDIQVAVQTGRLTFHLVDIGETQKWGYPVDDSKKHLWPNYALCAFMRPSQHDLVLIDGRFRIACALSCLLNTPDECTIMIHDFWDRRGLYFLLRFFHVKHQVDKLAVFTKRPNLNPKQLQRLLQRYQYDVTDYPLSARLKRPFTKKRYSKT